MSGKPSSHLAAALNEIAQAQTLPDLDGVRVNYLGKKGVVTELLKGLGGLPADQRPLAGNAINSLKQTVADAIAARRRVLEDSAVLAASASTIDVTLPGRGQRRGGLHPVTLALQKI